jgi:hypothetical protein
MDTLFTPQFFAEGGIAAIVGYFAYKAISGLYADMRADSLRRETSMNQDREKLTAHLGTLTETNVKIVTTLDRMDGRICILEQYCRPRREEEKP